MSSTSATKAKASKDKVSVMKLAKSNQFSTDMQGFKTSLNDIIKDYEPKIKVTYLDVAFTKIRLSKDDERVHCPVIILFLESLPKQVLKTIHWKHFPLNGEALEIFLSFSAKYLTLNSLRFEDVNFQESDIILLASFLRMNSNITDLSLKGNEYNESFSSLIQDTKLKYLTLRFCGLDGDNLEEFIEPIVYFHKSSLIYLNISNNRIGDKGAKILARMLRVNRILVSLNVSVNGITDEGARKLIGTLQMFHLNQDEISIRRKIYYKYYMMKYEEIDANIPTSYEEEKYPISVSSSMSNIKFKHKSKTAKSKNKRSSKSAASLSDWSSKSLITPRESSFRAQASGSFTLPYAEISDLIATLDFHFAYHPFVKETTLNGFKFMCRGNFVLSHLNLSFNQLTVDILKDIQEVVKYQIAAGSVDEGLKGVELFGNCMKSQNSEEPQNELAEMFTQKVTRTTSSATVGSRDLKKKVKRSSK